MNQECHPDGFGSESPIEIEAERPIGRDEELARLNRLLESREQRLITLTGPAGVGKTRLAMQAALDARDGFEGGLVIVPLAALRGPTLVVEEIARLLAIADGAGTLAERIASRLASRRTLLVLDNFEHLLPAAAEIGALLERCPELVVLVTSRAPLGLPGEKPVPIAPFLVSEAQQAEDSWEIPAVRLFVVRAEAAGAPIERTAENGHLIAEICRRLDGLPLAIELAAGNTPLVPLAAYLDVLDPRLPLLSAPQRPGPPHQRTMRDTIIWSYNLLPPHQQALFRRLAVFDGGFNREAAAALAAGWQPADGYPFAGGRPLPDNPPTTTFFGKEPPGHPEWRPEPLVSLPLDIDEGLANLCRHHLVQKIGGPAGQPRFGMLETIRECGIELLAASGEEAAVRHAQAVFVLGMIEFACSEFRTEEHLRRLALAEAELGNLRAALTWLADQGEPANQLLLRMAEAAGGLWYLHGRRGESRRWVELALTRQTGSSAARAYALNMAGILAWFQGDETRAEAALDEALAISQHIQAHWALARSHFFLALIAWRRNQYERLAMHLGTALPLYHSIGDPTGVSLCQIGLGILARGRRQFTEAATLLDKAYDLAREIHFAFAAASARFYRGVVALDIGDTRRAAAFWFESLSLYQLHGDPWGAGGCVASLACVAMIADQSDLAARLFGASAPLIKQGNAFVPPTELERFHAAAAAVRAKLGPLAFDRAFAEGRGWSVEQAVAAARTIEHPDTPPLLAATQAPSTSPRRALPLPGRPGAHNDLTARQMEIFYLLIEGQNAMEIAETFGKSRNWAYDQIKAICTKIGVSGDAELALYAIGHGLIELIPQ